MKVVPVLRDRCVEIERLVHVNEQMMMAAVRVIVAGVGDAHVPQAESNPEPAFDLCTVWRPYDVKISVLWCRLSLGKGGTRYRCQCPG
jgi:hypothetical protein